MRERPVYHLIARFVASEWFIETDHERAQYLGLLDHALRTSDWKCIAYAIMSNHIHLCMVAGKSPRSRWLRAVHSPFGEWINHRKTRIGAVFVQKPTTRVVAPDAVAKVVAYIHNNPVRAGVVSTARESSWTSHRAYLGSSSSPRWLHLDLGRALMRIDDPIEFDKFVESEAHRPRDSRGRRRGRPARKR